MRPGLQVVQWCLPVLQGALLPPPDDPSATPRPHSRFLASSCQARKDNPTQRRVSVRTDELPFNVLVGGSGSLPSQ